MKNISSIFIFLAIGTFAILISEKIVFETTNGNFKNYSESDLKQILISNNSTILKPLFSPDDPIKDILVGLINCEKKSIKMAAYTLTHDDIAQALIAASKRNIKIEIVCDRYFASDRFSKIPLLANNKIPIFVFQVPEDANLSGLMHNKIVIFESNIDNRKIMWTGSFNFTNRASTSNQENVIITDDKELSNAYNKQFDVLKQRSLLINGKIAQIKIEKPIKTNESWFDSALSFFNREIGFITTIPS